MQKRTLERPAPWVVTVVMFLLWEIICRLGGIPEYFLPAPTVIFDAMFTFHDALIEDSIYTLLSTSMGFGIAVVFGLLLGLLIGWSKTIYRGLYPVMVGFNSVPKVAVVPILVFWFGIGIVPAVLTAFLISFFPIVVNVATGLATTEPELEDVLRSLGASKLDIMLKVGIPDAIPFFFGSLKVAITLAFVGAVVSETVASNHGVRHLMLSAQANFEVPLVFAGLLVLAFEGIVMYAIFAAIEQRTAKWAYRSHQ